MQSEKYIFESTRRYVIRGALSKKLNDFLNLKERERIQKIETLKNNSTVTNINRAIKVNGLNYKVNMNMIRENFNRVENVNVGNKTFSQYFKGSRIPNSDNLNLLKDYLGIVNNFDLIFESRQAEIEYEHQLYMEIFSKCLKSENLNQLLLENYPGPIGDSPLNRVLHQYDNYSMCSELIRKIISEAWSTIHFIDDTADTSWNILNAMYLKPLKSTDSLLEEQAYMFLLAATQTDFNKIFEDIDTYDFSENSNRFTRYDKLESWEPIVIQNEALKNIYTFISTVSEEISNNVKIENLIGLKQGKASVVNNNDVGKMPSRIIEQLKMKYERF